MNRESACFLATDADDDTSFSFRRKHAANAIAMNAPQMVNSPPTGSFKMRPFWKRWFLDPILAQLTQGITPDKIALTIAIGSAIALFPVLGLTSLWCLLVGIPLRLNQPILHLLNQALFPLHLMAIYFCIRWGETLFGKQHVQYGGLKPMVHQMNHLFWNNQAQFWGEFGTLVWHAVVVWAILMPFWFLAVYFIARPIIRALARWKARIAASPDIPV